jgi:hypothetical protein
MRCSGLNSLHYTLQLLCLFHHSTSGHFRTRNNRRDCLEYGCEYHCFLLFTVPISCITSEYYICELSSECMFAVVILPGPEISMNETSSGYRNAKGLLLIRLIACTEVSWNQWRHSRPSRARGATATASPQQSTPISTGRTAT